MPVNEQAGVVVAPRPVAAQAVQTDCTMETWDT